MNCGLPAIGLDDGGHTEIISKGGRVFTKKEDVLKLLDDITQNYESFQNNIDLPNIKEVGKLYFEFIQKIYIDQSENNYKVKTANHLDYLIMKLYIYLWKFEEKIFAFKTKVFR
jgi:hypothetical protein